MVVMFSFNLIFFVEQKLDQHENIWRIGAKHPKAKQLLMRYATTTDKKTKGAGSRSLYYLIHGRPEQQKRKGVLQHRWPRNRSLVQNVPFTAVGNSRNCFFSRATVDSIIGNIY